MKKKIGIAVLAVGWVIAIYLVLHFFVYKPQIIKHRTEAFSQGANNVISSIVTQIDTQGEITITTDQGVITLVQKEEKKKRK